MRVAVAADHGGLEFKNRLLRYLRESGIEADDFGTSSEESCDYPDYGMPAVESVVGGAHQRAILICTNGIGMCMLANRHPEIRAALVYNERTARMTREHHDSNVLCLGGGEFEAEELLRFVDVWLRTEFAGGRHARRIKKFSDYS
ncbi:MAG: RpiB/LacA/LacB family sugar-phosphate isomerase [Planctomycetes bacterium]|nr:RpiB/LacA/LacB family sugar-phosphate isomerase [Planctomycetota bacterium]